MRISEYQVEFFKWQSRNFKGTRREDMLFGVIEETGELAHAHLKGIQGIRHTPEEILRQKRDAVADIFIYLCNYCSFFGFTFDESILEDDTKHGPESVNRSMLELSRLVGELASDEIEKFRFVNCDIVNGIVHGLIRYCGLSQIDFSAAIEETWERVQKRDWVSHPLEAGEIHP